MSRNREFDHQEILKKAQDLFWIKGYTDTSIQDLVEHLGLGRGSLYNTFGSKHDLFLEVLEFYNTNRIDYLTELLGGNNLKRSFKTFLHTFVDGIVSDDENKGCLFVNTKTQPISKDRGVTDIIAKGDEARIKMFEVRIKRAIQEEGIQLKQNPESLALFFSNTIQGLRILSKSGYSRSDYLSIADTALLVLEGA